MYLILGNLGTIVTKNTLCGEMGSAGNSGKIWDKFCDRVIIAIPKFASIEFYPV